MKRVWAGKNPGVWVSMYVFWSECICENWRAASPSAKKSTTVNTRYLFLLTDSIQRVPIVSPSVSVKTITGQESESPEACESKLTAERLLYKREEEEEVWREE